MERHHQMASIGDLLKERSIVLKGADALSAQGFTQVPNHVLRSGDITPGGKLAYAMLLSYAWQNDYCFPGQERLAKDMGVTDRSVRTYLQELQTKGFLTIKRQGLGKPNLYELDVSKNATLARKKGKGRFQA
jgi:biotin operon repressor